MTATFEEVKEYWQSASSTGRDAQGLRPTARDPYLQEIIEATAEKWLFSAARLVDIGCGDGHSTLRFSRRVQSAVGIDYIGAYVKQAMRNSADAGVSNAQFQVGSVLDLGDSKLQQAFDIAVTIRCLINLPQWEQQVEAIAQIASTLKPGGLYILSEGWSEGWDGLNRLRQRAGLEPLRLVRYNRLIPRVDFEREALKHFEIIQFETLGIYMFLSRLFQPAFVSPEPPRHDHKVNEIASLLFRQGVGLGLLEECDYAGIYVLRRR